MNLRRHRKAISALCLSAWLFALAVGLAYGCGWQPDHEAAVAPFQVASGDTDAPPPGCEDVCKDQAVIAKLQAVEDLPGGTAAAGATPSVPPAIQSSRIAHAVDAQPPPALSVSIRFLRLHL